MSYRLDRNESATDALRRLVREQLDAGLEDLEAAGGDDHDERIHDARKRLKKARAVLRLVRPALGEETFARENACFRDAAQQLGGARQGAALLECFDALRSAYGAELGGDGFAGVRRLLEDLRARAIDEALERGIELEVAQTLRLAAHRCNACTLEAAGWDALAGGLGKTYARGHKAFKRAYAEPSTESFHEWRKRVKYHWYHVRLLQEIWPNPMQARRRALAELAELLGDDHDLGELRGVLRALPPSLAADLRVDRLLQLVDQRERELRAEARHIGRRIYAERPKHLVRRFGGYFRAWKAHPAAAGSDAAESEAPAADSGDGATADASETSTPARNTSA